MAGHRGPEKPPLDTEHPLERPRVVLGVCGGIAAYKAVRSAAGWSTRACT